MSHATSPPVYLPRRLTAKTAFHVEQPAAKTTRFKGTRTSKSRFRLDRALNWPHSRPGKTDHQVQKRADPKEPMETNKWASCPAWFAFPAWHPGVLANPLSRKRLFTSRFRRAAIPIAPFGGVILCFPRGAGVSPAFPLQRALAPAPLWTYPTTHHSAPWKPDLVEPGCSTWNGNMGPCRHGVAGESGSIFLLLVYFYLFIVRPGVPGAGVK